MKIYKIWQKVNIYYDAYDSAVVCAKDEEDARSIHPSIRMVDWDGKISVWEDDWCDKRDVQVTYLGEADINLQRGVICASFNAG